MKVFKKVIISLFVIGLVVEGGLLTKEAYNYKKYKYASLNINGKIICKIDNTINFSGMASR